MEKEFSLETLLGKPLLELKGRDSSWDLLASLLGH
jgi:hypothetical protein